MAAHILSLQIGATNIPLTSANALLLDYNPATPSFSLLSAGQEIYGATRNLVTDSIRLHLYGSTGADVQSKIASIERFLELCAHRQQSRTGDRGYLYLNLGSDSEDWRSEILSGQVQPETDTLRTLEAAGADVLLIITRRPFWETVTERELPLDNGSAGGPATGGVTIYNHDDGDSGHDNWVDVAAADVAGNLPSPLRLRMTNNTGADILYFNFWQAINSHHSPTTFAHIIEGESMVGITQVADGGSSGGYFGRATWTTLIQHAVDLFKWSLPSALLTAAAGGFFRVLVRFANAPPTGMEFQLHIKTDLGASKSLWDGPKLTTTGNRLQDFGVVQLPPGVTGDGDVYYPVRLVISGEYTGTSQLDIDFVQLTPADSTRWFKQLGYGIPPDDSIENNGPTGHIHNIDAATGQRLYLYEAYSAVLHIWPNRAQRLFFLFDETTGMNVNRTSLIRAWYRPRRSTL